VIFLVIIFGILGYFFGVRDFFEYNTPRHKQRNRMWSKHVCARWRAMDRRNKPNQWRI